MAGEAEKYQRRNRLYSHTKICSSTGVSCGLCPLGTFEDKLRLLIPHDSKSFLFPVQSAAEPEPSAQGYQTQLLERSRETNLDVPIVVIGLGRPAGRLLRHTAFEKLAGMAARRPVLRRGLVWGPVRLPARDTDRGDRYVIPDTLPASGGFCACCFDRPGAQRC